MHPVQLGAAGDPPSGEEGIRAAPIEKGHRQLGCDTEALLTATGVGRAALAAPFGAVPNDAFGLLWMAAFRQRPDPTLPTQVGLAVPFNEFGILDHLVTAAETGESVAKILVSKSQHVRAATNSQGAAA